MGRHRGEARERLFETKPLTAWAIERTGLSRKDLQSSAGIGEETLREAPEPAGDLPLLLRDQDFEAGEGGTVEAAVEGQQRGG